MGTQNQRLCQMDNHNFDVSVNSTGIDICHVIVSVTKTVTQDQHPT